MTDIDRALRAPHSPLPPPSTIEAYAEAVVTSAIPSSQITVRILHRLLGGHVHCRVFVGREGAGAKAGDLTFRAEEWDVLQGMLLRAGFTVRVEDRPARDG